MEWLNLFFQRIECLNLFFQRTECLNLGPLLIFLNSYHFLNIYSNLQLRDLERGVGILVATPDRLADLMETTRISLQAICYLALVKADRMLDMGFEPQLEELLSKWTCHFQVSSGQCCLVQRSQKRSRLAFFLIFCWHVLPE